MAESVFDAGDRFRAEARDNLNRIVMERRQARELATQRDITNRAMSVLSSNLRETIMVVSADGTVIHGVLNETRYERSIDGYSECTITFRVTGTDTVASIQNQVDQAQAKAVDEVIQSAPKPDRLRRIERD